MPQSTFLLDLKMGAEVGLLLLAVVWCTRAFYYRMSEGDRLNRLIQEKQTLRERHESNARRLGESLGTLQGRVLPEQIKLLSQLEEEVRVQEKALEGTGLPARVKFLREVREHWEKDPGADRFRGSEWKPWDDAP